MHIYTALLKQFVLRVQTLIEDDLLLKHVTANCVLQERLVKFVKGPTTVRCTGL